MKTIKMCPGCGHTPIAKNVEEILQREKGILVGSVGCSVSLPVDMENIDAVSSAHGRALSVATGMRRVLGNEKTIIVYAGDGDSLNIGIGEFVHSCLRNDKLIYVIVDNSCFSMTGHQMSATTDIDIKTKTCIEGRKEEYHGIPINVKNLVNALNSKVKYHLTTSATKDGINNFKTCLEESLNNDNLTIIHVISPCPIFWGNVKKAYEFSNNLYERLKNE